MQERVSALTSWLLVLVACGGASIPPSGPTEVVVKPGAEPQTSSPAPLTPQAGMQLAVYEVDDASNALAPLAANPPAGNVELGVEDVPEPRVYAAVVFAPGEAAEAAKRRLEEAVRTVALPPGCFIAFQPAVEEGEQKGWRTYVLRGEPLLTDVDVRAAELQTLDNPLGQIVLNLELSAEGAGKLADLTERFNRRRIAFVVDGVVMIAPVVMDRIDGGRATLFLPGVDASEVPSQFASGVRIER